MTSELGISQSPKEESRDQVVPPKTKSGSSKSLKMKRDIYRTVRPYLFKLFTHFLLLLLSVRGYYQFLSSEDNYSDFLNIMNEPVIVDIQEISSQQECQQPYEGIQQTTFPSTVAGCRCDYQIFTKETCKIISSNLDLSVKGRELNQTTCTFQDSQIAKRFNSTKYSSNGRQLYSFSHTCGCYQDIPAIHRNKTINLWANNTRTCILKDPNTTTLSYLQTAFQPCDPKNRCQNYFCKTNNDENYKCPVVDAYYSHVFKYNETYLNKTSKRDWDDDNYDKDGRDDNCDFKNRDNNQPSLVFSSQYNSTYIDAYTNQNTLIIPIIGMHMTRNGKCENGEDSLNSNYALISDIKCSISQRFYTTSKQSIIETLNNNDNYYNYLRQKLPLFGLNFSKDNKWNLDLEYSFYRNTLTCLMTHYDDIYQNFYDDINETTVFKYQQAKLSNVLSSFIKLDNSNLFLDFFQIFILVMNVIIVVVNLVIIIYKFIKVLKPIPSNVIKYFNNEIYVSFFMDILISFLGGFSFYVMYIYIDILNMLLNTNCLDDGVRNKLNLYSDALQSTAESSLQVFVIMLVKLFMIIFSIFYYLISEKCNITCEKIAIVIKENLNEGDDPEEDHEEEGKVSKKDSEEFELQSKMTSKENKVYDSESNTGNGNANLELNISSSDDINNPRSCTDYFKSKTFDKYECNKKEQSAIIEKKDSSEKLIQKLIKLEQKLKEDSSSNLNKSSNNFSSQIDKSSHTI